MRKLIFLSFLTMLFWSCSLNDDTPNFHNEAIPIESVSMPTSFLYNEINTISYTYYRPSTCHVFYDLYYVAENSTRTVAVINSVYDDENCITLNEEPIERSFQFVPLNYGTYTFKFWTGVDENDEDEFLIYEILVEE